MPEEVSTRAGTKIRKKSDEEGCVNDRAGDDEHVVLSGGGTRPDPKSGPLPRVAIADRPKTLQDRFMEDQIKRRV